MKKIQPFHLAIPVQNLTEARKFYKVTLGLTEGRSSNHWVDFDFFGHQFVIHEDKNHSPKLPSNTVDGKAVPIPHFGVVLSWEDFHQFAKNLEEKKVSFQIEPYIRFKGETGEQATMFFYDPSGNALEFKAFKNQSQLFAKN
ncbi:VOC family protein [Mesonia aquimarina]|uniref:VOC family protein n=1 Tax=Mesonia aquimarina TaxID=1504967 RepID=UPI000EF59597|nr:VOC family protein [Mesonia aquimarina]